MGKIREWLRKLYDKLRGRFYEGPDPPERLRQAVNAYASMGEHTMGDWIEFASRLAEESYRSGYLRGVEWHDRAAEHGDPTDKLEQLALQERGHGWSWIDQVPAEADMARLVESESDLLERMSPEARLRYEDRIAQQYGVRVVLLPPDEPDKS